LAGLGAAGLGGDQPFHALAHLADIADAPYFFIRDTDVEFVFQSEQDLDGVHGIDSQLLKFAVDGDGFERNPLGGRDYL